jgi:hypothetical protein
LFLPLKVRIGTWGKGRRTKEASPEVEEETTTENISSAGCYFLLSEEPKVGSRVDLEVEMAPTSDGRQNGRMLCQGRVVRVHQDEKGGKTGVACAIDRYQIVPPQNSETNTDKGAE